MCRLRLDCRCSIVGCILPAIADFVNRQLNDVLFCWVNGLIFIFDDVGSRLNRFQPRQSLAGLGFPAVNFDKAILRLSVNSLLWLDLAVMIAKPLYLKGFTFFIVY